MAPRAHNPGLGAVDWPADGRHHPGDFVARGADVEDGATRGLRRAVQIDDACRARPADGVYDGLIQHFTVDEDPAQCITTVEATRGEHRFQERGHELRNGHVVPTQLARETRRILTGCRRSHHHRGTEGQRSEILPQRGVRCR